MHPNAPLPSRLSLTYTASSLFNYTHYAPRCTGSTNAFWDLSPGGKPTMMNPFAPSACPQHGVRSIFVRPFGTNIPFPALKRVTATKGEDGQVLENEGFGTPKGVDLIPDNTAWDPEGILGPSKLGGHFARRKEGNISQPSSILAPVTKKADQAVTIRPPSSGEQIMTAPGEGIGDLIEEAFLETFWGQRAAPRILDSFRRLRSGQEFVQLWPGDGLQRAESYVEGLTATPFPDFHSGAYPWLEEVEKHASVFIEEFKHVTSDDVHLKEKGTNIWVPAARKEAVAYGPSWRTLVLQDRGVWDPINSKLFPRTKQMLVDAEAPTLEVFFARQEAGTGIASHTDNANFVQTSHLGLDVPEGSCWIKVGEHRRHWKNGCVLCMDTSFMHETANESDRDRYVLIMRHWHPELTQLERIAVLFLFAALDEPSASGIRSAQRDAAKALGDMLTTKKGSRSGSYGLNRGEKMKISSGGGFGSVSGSSKKASKKRK